MDGQTALALFVTALSLTAVGIFAYFTVWSADDYLYATFLDDGLKNYARLLAYHYKSFNGRVIVHIAAQIILNFGPWLFALVCVSLCAAIPALSALADGQARIRTPLCAAIFTAGFLAIPAGALSQGVYWISAFCNYMLPTAMMCLLLFTGLCAPEGRSWPRRLFPILAVLCGATTEQSGTVALLLTAYFAVKAVVRRRGRVSALSGLAGAAFGLWTVFHSPATSARASDEASVRSLSELAGRVSDWLYVSAKQLSMGWLIPLALAALFVLTGLEAEKRRHGLKWAFCGPALLALGALFWDSQWLFAALLVLAGLDGAALIALKRECPGLLVFMGLASLTVLVTTTSLAGRTALPMCVYLLAAVSVTLAGADVKKPAIGRCLPAALMCASLISAVPMARGWAYNWETERINRENAQIARDTGHLDYCLDYDYRYTWIKIDVMFANEYLRVHGLDPEGTEISFYTRSRPRTYAAGQEQYPAYRTTDGKVYFHLRVLEAFGGTIIPREGFSGFDHLTVTLPWMSADMDTDWTDRVAFSATDGRTCAARRTTAENRTWLPAEVYTGFFGLEIDYDEAGDAYFISVPEVEQRDGN